MQKNDFFKGVFATGIILLIGLIAINGLMGGDEIIVPNRPTFNVEDVSYRVAVGKPETALFEGEIANSNEKGSNELTVYNQNLALVKDIRELTLKKGVNLVQFKDIASQINATSVFFKDLTFPNTFVIEQNYEYDLVSKNKILEKYLDEEITIQVIEGDQVKEYKGKLLSFQDGIILESNGEIIALSNTSKISFKELPGGLLTKPTLVWKIYADQDGVRETQTIYLTGGLNWQADYIATVNSDDSALDFSGWTTIKNNSGTSYPNTKLKLVAGDVHTVTSNRYPELYEEYATDSVGSAMPKSFGEESLFEYHMYTLESKTTLNNNQTKQISLLSSENVPIQKIFYYDGARQGTKVQVKIEFKNSENQGLGLPLPKGKVRVYKEDSSGKQQFIGEDSIDHTPKDEDTTLFLGNAFDIVGERTQVSNENLSKGWYRTSYEITLSNHKDTAENIVVHEYVGQSWDITQKSHEFEQKNSSEIEFNINVPANGETTITYTIDHKYYW